MLNSAHAVFFFNTETELLKLQDKLNSAASNMSVEYQHNCYIFEDEWQETGYKNRSEAFIKLQENATLQEYVQLTKMLQEVLEEGETDESYVLVDCFYNDQHIC
jgi:hypothetical protein